MEAWWMDAWWMDGWYIDGWVDELMVRCGWGIGCDVLWFV